MATNPIASHLPPVSTMNEARYDLMIIGGGMAGVMAALAAKHEGIRILVVEPNNVLGGQGTAGGVAGFCGDTERVNGEFAALVTQLARYGLIAPYSPNDDRRPYDLEWCAFFLQEMVVNRGIDVLLQARVIGARAVDGRVEEIVVSTSSGLENFRPKFVIDASGSCVVPMLAGFPVVHEGSNRQLPMSLYFTLWDSGKPVTPVLPEGCPSWRDEEEIPMTSVHQFPTGKVEVKMKVVGFDAADGFSRSAAEIFARRQMHGLIYFLQTIGYRNRRFDTHVLASVSRAIGIREERRIVGEHVLTEAEVRRAVIFDDAVAVNTYHIDYHWPDKMERAGTGITDMLDPHHLPLRMMIPKDAVNLLVPGRGSSGDQTAMSAYRVMAVVAQMGYAAGVAAGECITNKKTLRDLDVRAVQALIRAGGQSLNLSDYGNYLKRDLFTDEHLPMGVKKVEELSLVQVENACFLVVWKESGVLRGALRSEKVWRLLTEGETRTAAHSPQQEVTLDEGIRARAGFASEEGNLALEVALSRDGGGNWFARRLICEHLESPSAKVLAMVATRTGMAVIFTEGERLRFWHGSVERIIDGPPKAAAHTLQA